MKKLLFICCMVMLLPAYACAQNRMEFNGVLMGQPREKFVSELSNKGYKLILKDENNIPGDVLTGKFHNRPDYVIRIVDTGENKILEDKLVWCVHATSPIVSVDSYKFVVDEYNYFVSLFTKKYGEPKSRTRNGCMFETQTGNIIVQINDDMITHMNVEILYIDKLTHSLYNFLNE